ncbi:hypothetical protein RMATCC62417_12595 [Rhizopus microsporus]|nr:hypothetical protein RMATCC62417_12595 [Rhizopus microsporus]
MTEKASTTVGRASSVKRKSILSELGIKPGAEPVSPKPTTRTSPTSTASKTKTATRPSTVPSATRPSKTPVTRKAPPAAIKTDRTTPTSSATSSPTVPKRRSIVPSSTASNRPPNSPLARRSSVNHSPSTSNAAKRMSTPVGLAELTIKEKVPEQEELLEQKEKEIENLKQEHKQNVSKLQEEIDELKKQLESNKTKDVAESNDKDSIEKAVQEIKAKLKQEHQEEMEKVLEEQEKKLRSEMAITKAEYEEKINTMQSKQTDITKQLDFIKAENVELKAQLQKEKDEHKENNDRHASEITELNEKIASLEKSHTNSHIRKVESELTNAKSALEEFKRQSQLHIEAIEQRHREEIRQLQSGTDDTAMAWLEKTKATQQEVHALHDELQRKEAAHNESLTAIKEQYENKIELLKQTCDKKETEIEERSAQIESLLFQVETLQNSLEAATVRFEHTAKSTPSSSSNRDDINAKPHDTSHEQCVKRYEAKQKELDDLKVRLAEIKETHESQLNRLGQEKANAIQELRKAIAQLEQKQKSGGSGSVSEERLIQIAEQHKKEIQAMHEQYQHTIDAKNKELEDYAYRVKALVASKQKELEKLQIEKKMEEEKYDREVEGYEVSFLFIPFFLLLPFPQKEREIGGRGN